jgi:hypothetical protein
VEHASGLHVRLHVRPFALPYYDAPLDDFVRSGGRASIDGTAACVPPAESTLVHVLGHASYSASRRNLRWMADAWHLLSRHPGLDWDLVASRVQAYRLTLPVSVLLDYLADFGMPVPPDVVARLRKRAAAAVPVAEDVALGGALAATQGDVRRLWRSTRSWRGRVRVARWAVAPSPAYVRSAFAPPRPWLYPLLYFYRPARFAAAKLRRPTRPSAAGT